MTDIHRERTLWRRIRWLTWLFIFGLVLSGATAIPLLTELNWLAKIFPTGQPLSAVNAWLLQVRTALTQIQTQFPFIFYGTDWLAFGHFIIALAFIGALRDPVRNRWLFDFGLLACASVIPYALIFGEIRGLPLWWRLIDCSFGVVGALPLWLCRRWAIKLEADDENILSRRWHR